MANPQLEVNISANIEALRKGLTDAVTVTEKAGKDIEVSTSRISSNISKNIASFNKKPIDDFISTLNKGSASVSTFGVEFSKISTNISNNLKAFDKQKVLDFANSFKRIPTDLPVLPKLTVGSNRAADALTNLGRVAQDAPFGFIGIQNNLNPLLESFQRLRAESGSNAAAFKALGSSLIGPAGIGIALSVVSAGILLYQQYQQKANKATENAKKVTDDYVKSLDAVTGEQLKGEQNAQREITNLNLLFSAYQNANLPLNKRKEAYEQIQKEYPDYFGNIKFEEEATARTKAAYDQLTASIIATARARAAGDKITQNESRKLENEQKTIDLEKAIIKERSIIQKQQERFDKANNQRAAGSAGIGASQEQGITAAKEASEKRVNVLISQQNNLKTDSNKLTAENGRLVEFVNKQILEGGKIIDANNGKTTKTREETDKIAEIYRKLASELKSNPLVFGATQGDIAEDNIKSYQTAIDGLIANGYEPASKAVQDLIDKQNALVTAFRASQGSIQGGKVDATTGVSLPGVTRGITIPPIAPAVDENTKALATLRNEFNFTDKEIGKFVSNYGMNFKEILSVTKEFNAGISDVLNSGAISAISGIGEAIGNSLANGTSIIEAVGKGLLSSFGDILVQLGQVAIQTGVGIAAIKTALKSLNPVVAIAAGAGLIALGTLIKGKIANIGGGNNNQQTAQTRNVRQFASGVNNFSGGLAIVGERGPELVNLPTGSSVVNNTKTMDMLGNARNDVNINLESGLSISAEQLYMFVKKGEKAARRSGYNG